MPRFQITIAERQLQQLAKLAANERRPVRDHAAVLLEQKITEQSAPPRPEKHANDTPLPD